MISKFESGRNPGHQRITWRTLIIAHILLAFLTACGAGAVQFAPTPLPPDTSPMTYTHPSQAFSITIPRDWAIFEQNLTTFASVAFAPPSSDQPLLRIAVTRTQPIADINAFITRYQTQIRPDRNRYTEQERQLMPDGSWRITATLSDAVRTPRPLNTFIQQNGAFLAVIDTLIPRDEALLTALERAVNTFALNDDAEFEGDVEALTRSATRQLEIANVSLWTNPEGVFFITGEIANHGQTSINSVPIEAVLLNDDGMQLAGALTTSMGHALTPGGFAPFGLRFGQGQPFEAQNFRLTITGDEERTQAPDNLVLSPQITWTDAIQIAQEGQIFVVGTVENRAEQALYDVRIVVTLFDEAGRVIGAGFANADASVLAPDATADYVVLVADVGGLAANYVVNVQALACDTDIC